MAELTNTISSFINTQVPGFIREQDPNFVAFLKAYYAWMEQSNTGAVLYHTRNLMDYKQVDNTTDDFIDYFKKDFLPYFPDTIALDEKKLLKVANKFYKKKGSEESVKFLFRVLYNKDAQIFYPKQNILKASDGKWQLPQSLKISLSANNQGFDVQQLKGRVGIGSTSNATCVIESVNKTVDSSLNREIVELYVSKLARLFDTGEYIQIPYGTYANGTSKIFQELIIGSISAINIDPNRRGLRYVGTIFNPDGTIQYQGDPVVVTGGLADTADAIEAVAYVGNVTSGQLQSIEVIDGGYGFRLHPNTLVTITSQPGDTGAGANAIVQSLDTTNQVFILINTDSIEYMENQTLDAVNYGFANVANSNANSTLANAWSFANIAFAPIASMNVINGGTGYSEVPDFDLLSVYDSDLATDLYQNYLLNPNTATYNLYATTRQTIRDLGYIAAIEVTTGGSGYSNVTDMIAINSSLGRNAVFNFITTGNGAISRVIVTNRGEGYIDIQNTEFRICNSANLMANSNGTGAVLRGYGYSEGEDLAVTVSDIGRIQTIRLVNRGFDYVATPNVSLRVQDVTVVPLGNNEFFFENDLVYQGANANSASFTAMVDFYDRANSVLRIYDYIGTINLSTTLIGSNVNATPLSTQVYGNGKARANAEFLNGLINYPGFYLNTDGFLSADQFLQDDQIYHNYSYIIKVEEALKKYKQTLMNIVHPAGTKMLGLYTITDDVDRRLETGISNVAITNDTTSVGLISVNAFANGIITGIGTTFVDNIHAGDLFTIAYNIPGRAQTKEVREVINNESLILESNTMYFGTDRLTSTNNSNILVSSATSSNLAANDIIKLQLNSNGSMITVGGFDTDTSGDGLADGWANFTNSANHSLSTGRISGNAQRYTVNGENARIRSASGFHAYIPPSINVRVSGWIKANSGYTACLACRGTNTSTGSTNVVYQSNISNTTGDWQQLSSTFVCDANAPYMMITLGLFGTAPIGTVVEIDDVELSYEGILTPKVMSVTGANVTTNITFAANTANMPYIAYPSFANVDYSILTVT